MRHNLVWGVVLALLVWAGVVSAQTNDEITLVPFTNEMYGIQGVIPEAWQEVGGGVYGRAPNTADMTLIVLQVTPAKPDLTLNSLLPRLGLTEAPDSVGTVETAAFTWTLYKIDVAVGSIEVAVDLALAEQDNKTYLVILQTAPDEYETLHASVFEPVLNSLALLAVEATPENLPYTAEEVTFTHDDITLAGTLTLPAGDAPYPAVVLITGSGSQDRDESLAPIATIKPFRLIADYLTRNGIAVLRYDDRGIGGSTGDPITATSADFADDAAAAIDYLLTRDDINPEQIGVLGHSEGGLIAAMLGANNPDVAFIISLAGTAVSGRDIILKQSALILAANGGTEAQVQDQVDFLDQAFALVTAEDQDPDALRTLIYDQVLEQAQAMPEDQRAALGDLEAYANAQADQQAFALNSNWYRFFLDYDPAQDWSKVTMPVLAIFGGLDLQVDAEQNRPALEAALTKAGNTDYEIIVIPGANHLFQQAETGSPSEYGTLEQTFAPDLLPTITAWLLEHVDVPQE